LTIELQNAYSEINALKQSLMKKSTIKMDDSLLNDSLLDESYQASPKASKITPVSPVKTSLNLKVPSKPITQPVTQRTNSIIQVKGETSVTNEGEKSDKKEGSR
jgi:hypothetical protein